MKRVVLLLTALLGFAAGWNLPSRSAPAPAPVSAPVTGENTRRELRKRALFESLLSDQERATYRSRSAPLGELLAMGLGPSADFSDEDIARIVTMDPVASMDELLSNPVASSSDAGKVAAEWARRQPQEALRYLTAKHSYRADDCLAAALPAAYLSHPQLVGEILRSKPRAWQERYLADLFKNTYTVRNGVPPEQETDDPFADSGDRSDSGDWNEIRFGTDLLDCLADDELRAKAKACWEKDDDEKPTATTVSAPEVPSSWDPVTYDPGDSAQRDALLKDLREKKEETIAKIAAEGSHKIRAQIIEYLVGEVPYSYKDDSAEWVAALERVEAGIHQLGVIPEYPPSHFEQGPYLRGSKVAEWIDRQPLGLRRAWAPTFVETWAQTDSQAALKWAEALPEEASRDQSVQTGLIVWTHQDPQAAVAHVDGLPPGELREAAISNAAATWDCIDPAAAREWVAGLPESPGKQRALERLKRR